MTTTFVEDATTNEQKGRVNLFDPIGPNLQDAQTLALFLAKPHLLGTFNWNTTDPVGIILIQESIKSLILSVAPWKNKIAGYSYMRGTAVIRLELNAQPFQSGKLLMHFLPQYQYRVGISNTFANHNASLGAKTQQYSVELDARDSSAIIRIPYIAPTAYCSFKSDVDDEFLSDWGSIFVSVLSPLQSVADTTASISYFISVEDAEFAAPTFQVEPQMRKPKSKKQQPPPEESQTNSDVYDYMSGYTTDEWDEDGKPHNRFAERQALRKEREKAKQGGAVSSTLDAISGAADYLSEIPVIGSYVKGGKSILDGASNLFKAFGWSKPQDTSTQQIFGSQYARNLNNLSGLDISYPLAMDPGHRLAPIPCVDGTDKDEMSFAFLKKIPAYVNTFSWSKSEVASTLLYQLNVSPVTCTEVGFYTAVGAGYIQPIKSGPPFTFLSRYFSLYRGSIEVTLKFVKNQFYTGRVLVAFDPNTTSGNIMFSENTGLREIIDLKDSSEITLNLPYLSNTNYLSIDESIGRLRIYVLNQLAAPDTVESSINVLVYYNAGDDFELAKPISDFPTPVVSVVPEMNIVQPVLAKKRIGGYPDSPLTDVAVKSSLGEAFMSIKQLILCSRPVSFNSEVTTFTKYSTSGTDAYLSNVAFNPWVFGLPRLTGAGFAVPYLTGDYLSELATGYSYYRGGLRYTIPKSDSSYTVARLIGNDANDLITGSAPLIPTTSVFSGNRTWTDLTSIFPTLTATILDDTKATLDVNVPYYGKTPFRMVNNITDGVTTYSYDADTSLLQILKYTENSVNTAPSLRSLQRPIMRGASDDFQFMYFIGFAPWAWGAPIPSP